MYQHPRSLSPDPLYAHPGKPAHDGGTSLDVYPHAMEWVRPAQGRTGPWAAKLDLYRRPGKLELTPDSDGRLEIVLDFGTELEGELELDCQASSLCTVYVTFGESVPEANGWGVQGQVPVPTAQWHMPAAGRHRNRFGPRGFRFIRIAAHDVVGRLVLNGAVVHAWFAFRERRGDFHCSDARMQRVWQSSVYTARLCAREKEYWDGVKRDRLGWYGDARITQETTDAAFGGPAPAVGMLLGLQTDSWANGIPGYSFDGVAMFRQLLLAHGTRVAGTSEIYARMKKLLDWTARTQTAANGLLMRRDGLEYFFGMGFVDWAPMPVGGRFEELSWLQCKYLEALRNAADVAAWLGRRADVAIFSQRADRLGRLITRRFWRAGEGFIHTLNQTCKEWKQPSPDEHYRDTYIKKVRLGASGPSRHSAALAVWAGLCNTPGQKEAAVRALAGTDLPHIITGYFKYYEQAALAACGRRAEAIMTMRDFVGEQLEFDDAPCTSEYFEASRRDIRRWSLHGYPKSMCHGWSSGTVGVTARHLLGVTPVAPGYAAITIDPVATLPWTFEATIPTPHGAIQIERETPKGPIHYTLPKGVKAISESSELVRVETR